MFPSKELFHNREEPQASPRAAHQTAGLETPLKLIGVFVLKLLVVFGLLMMPWSGLGEAYEAFYQTGGQALFGSFGSAVSVRFQPAAKRDEIKDTEIILLNRQAPRIRGGIPAGRMFSSSRYVGYVPSVFLIALVLATPVSWRRRGLALAFGIVLLHCFVSLRLAVSLLNALSEDNAIRAFELSPPLKGLVRFTVQQVWESVLTCSYLVPTVIWILVTFRRSDWDRLCGRNPVGKNDPGRRGEVPSQNP